MAFKLCTKQRAGVKSQESKLVNEWINFPLSSLMMGFQ